LRRAAGAPRNSKSAFTFDSASRPKCRRSDGRSLLAEAQPSLATLPTPPDCQELAELERLLLVPGGGSVPSQLLTKHGVQTSPKQQDRESVHRSTDPGCSAEGTPVNGADRSSPSSCTAEEACVAKEDDSQQQQKQRRGRQQQQHRRVLQPIRQQRHSKSRKASQQLPCDSAVLIVAAPSGDSSKPPGKQQIIAKEVNIER